MPERNRPEPAGAAGDTADIKKNDRGETPGTNKNRASGKTASKKTTAKKAVPPRRTPEEPDTGKTTRHGQPDTPKDVEAGDDFPVVGIGASAGGLDAFHKFFSNTTADTGMAFILVQHLDPTHASNMVELLRRFTSIPVSEAEDGMKIEPDHIYMIPPNKIMTTEDRTLRLGEQLERPGISHSIDLFFNSLAKNLKEKAICIILSGTGTDGSIGAKAVKAELGMVMVQEPQDAAYDGMPLSAINAGLADFILPADKMAKQLLEYVSKSFGKRAIRRREVEKDITSLNSILMLVRTRTRRDFSGYKQSTINRRIERRMSVNRIDNIGQYLKLLRESKQEVDALVKDFLINVTSFFRDPEAFEKLKIQIKKMIQSEPEGHEIRAWVPGCSTGEEAYSLLLVIEEVLEELGKYYPVQIFGTDLDTEAINTARRGSYPASIAADVSPKRLKQFFTKNDDRYQIKRELREKVVFAVQDVTTDPPFSRIDFISARNLLIYFDTGLQKRLIPMFHYALKENGLLFLGTAETVGEYADLFTAVDRKWKIYRAMPVKRSLPIGLPGQPEWRKPEVEHRDKQEPAILPIYTQLMTPDKMLLEALPPSVLVDDNYQLLYSHGDTRQFIGLPEGAPNTDIAGLVHPEIKAQLLSMLHEAQSTDKQVVKENVQVRLNGQTQPIKIKVKPVSAPRPLEPRKYIITFEDMPQIKHRRKQQATTTMHTQELEQELQSTRESLRSTIEELETANEELRSSNEEYQSTNEELQSTNEELETSREELQSVNEELSTVNAEHQAKIDELSTVNDDMKNLLNSTGVATIYLDNKLRVKRFTPAATEIFNLIPSDADRPISHINSQIIGHDLTKKAEKVLDTLVPIIEDVKANNGNWFSMRIIPYRTTDNSIWGVVATFIDITTLKNTQEELERCRQEQSKNNQGQNTK
jgi:two-component system CheB/CheR fusion protein